MYNGFMVELCGFYVLVYIYPTACTLFAAKTRTHIGQIGNLINSYCMAEKLHKMTGSMY